MEVDKMRRKINRILLFTSIITLGVTILTSIPLFINYLKGSDVQFPLFVDLHVWLGLVFTISTLSRMILNRKTVINMLKRKG